MVRGDRRLSFRPAPPSPQELVVEFVEVHALDDLNVHATRDAHELARPRGGHDRDLEAWSSFIHKLSGRGRRNRHLGSVADATGTGAVWAFTRDTFTDAQPCDDEPRAFVSGYETERKRGRQHRRRSVEIVEREPVGAVEPDAQRAREERRRRAWLPPRSTRSSSQRRRSISRAPRPRTR